MILDVIHHPKCVILLSDSYIYVSQELQWYYKSNTAADKYKNIWPKEITWW